MSKYRIVLCTADSGIWWEVEHQTEDGEWRHFKSPFGTYVDAKAYIAWRRAIDENLPITSTQDPG